jgi:antitoxin YefM
VSHVSYTELRANLAKFMDEVCDTHAALHITRQNARTVVMLSEEEYEGMLETLHLLRSPANATRLLRSLESAEKDALTERDLTEAQPRE